MWKVPVVFILALVLGFAVTRTSPTPSAETGDAVKTKTPPMASRPAPLSFENWVKWLGRKSSATGTGSDHPADEFKDWSENELHAALDQGLLDPSAALHAGLADQLMSDLFGEWMKRNPDAAFAWFESIQSKSRKTKLSGILVANWPKDKIGEGLSYVSSHRDLFVTNVVRYSSIVAAAIEDAAKRGPDAVDKLLGQLRQNRIDPEYSWPPPQFPPHFDFAALAASPEAVKQLKGGVSCYAGAWLSQDRNAAYEHFIGSNQGELRRLLPDFFRYVAPVGEVDDQAACTERAQWLAEKLNGLDAEQRRKIALSGVNGLEAAPTTLANFAAALSDPDDRQAVTIAAVRDLMRRSLSSSLEFLEAVGEPELRFNLLENDEAVTYYRHQAQQSEALLREKLTAWSAPPDRIERIIQRLKGGGE